MNCRLFVFAALLACLGCGGKPGDKLDKHPVTGKVLVDGTPAAGVVVRFFKDGKPGQTNADTPLAVTKEDGTFELSTNGDGDGAVVGSYRVTFFWKTSNAPGSPDLLGGKYVKLDESKINVDVVSGSNALEPFQLQKPASSADGDAASPTKNVTVPNAPPPRR